MFFIDQMSKPFKDEHSDQSSYRDFWVREIAKKNLENLFILSVDSIEALCANDAINATYLLEVHASQSLPIAAGESVAVYAHNRYSDVQKIFESWKTSPDAVVCVDSHEYHLEEVITHLLDIYSPPKKQLLMWMSERAASPEDQLTLSFLASTAGSSLYTKMAAEHLGLAFYLCNFPLQSTSLLELLEFVPSLAPRYYSPCNWSNSGRLSLCFTLEAGGLCSNWMHSLASMPSQEKFMCVSTGERKLQPFKFVEIPRNPLIFVATGAGIAPFIGLMEFFAQKNSDDSHDSHDPIEIHLFYGCRHPQKDFLFRERLQSFYDKLNLKVYSAFSRYESYVFRYVQDLLLQNTSLLCNLISEKNGAIYVCGNACKMVKSVKEAFDKIFAEVAPSFSVNQLMKEKRYMMEIW